MTGNNWYCNSAGANGILDQCKTCAHNPKNMTDSQRALRGPLAAQLIRKGRCVQWLGIIKPVGGK